MTDTMRTVEQCMAKAVEMDGFVLTCGLDTASAYRKMAVDWRRLARQAAWQDGFRQGGDPIST